MAEPEDLLKDINIHYVNALEYTLDSLRKKTFVCPNCGETMKFYAFGILYTNYHCTECNSVFGVLH